MPVHRQASERLGSPTVTVVWTPPRTGKHLLEVRGGKLEPEPRRSVPRGLWPWEAGPSGTLTAQEGAGTDEQPVP